MPEKREPADLESDLAGLLAMVLTPATTSDELMARLDHVYAAFNAIDFAHYDTHRLADHAPALIQQLFDTRMQLREQLRSWQHDGLLSGQVQRSLRDVFRAMRYGADMLGEVTIGFRQLINGAHPLTAFRGRDMNTLINPRFNERHDLPFQSGDVLLVRGRHHNSAAIARIGDVDSQYSHLGIIYIDPKGHNWIVEVLIEDGGTIQPLGKALNHELGRAIVLRHRDAALAQRAAFIAHEHVKHSLSRYGKPILYDFTMHSENPRRMYCSRLIGYAFERASEGKCLLPTFPTHLVMGNKDFFKRIGVTADVTFAPGDLELEPDFDVVAEWQDYRTTASLRHQDIVMDKLFAWMDQYQLRFKETFIINIVSWLGRRAAGFSNTVKSMIADVIPKVPAHMPRRTIATIVMLHRTADPLMHEIGALEQERIGLFGHPLHPREIGEYLERIRAKSANEIGYLVPAAKP
ncbi:MAG TPA: YiiX/YebB-like N1pC/P60 family cysteine hydrolase, partial [Hyphomicrobiaceae bacterium]|nr:YiiX/YebB-like N1pC/P60 family cysteine hydrolase [Hyphomicrobiaceae bacterium]